MNINLMRKSDRRRNDHGDNGKFRCRADKLLTAFLEVKSAILGLEKCLD
jgi:hypothetical protein